MSSSGQTEGDAAAGGDAAPPRPEGGLEAVMAHMKADKLDAALWISRILNMVFTFLYLVTLVGNPVSHYQKSLISGAAISAFRLHTRMPQVTLTRDFLASLVKEDSFHYLIFCLVFLTFAPPVTMALTPVFLFSLLHVTKYTGVLLNCLGPNSMPFLRGLLTKVDTNQRTLLRFIACNEIFLMPLSIMLILGGQAALFLPLVYYQFLCLRYSSQRNPYSRLLFSELRHAAINLCAHPKCPSLVSSLIYRLMGLITRLAPNVPTA